MPRFGLHKDPICLSPGPPLSSPLQATATSIRPTSTSLKLIITFTMVSSPKANFRREILLRNHFVSALIHIHHLQRIRFLLNNRHRLSEEASQALNRVLQTRLEAHNDLVARLKPVGLPPKKSRRAQEDPRRMYTSHTGPVRPSLGKRKWTEEEQRSWAREESYKRRMLETELEEGEIREGF